MALAGIRPSLSPIRLTGITHRNRIWQDPLPPRARTPATLRSARTTRFRKRRRPALASPGIAASTKWAARSPKTSARRSAAGRGCAARFRIAGTREASVGFGQYKQDQWRRNEINGLNLIQALQCREWGRTVRNASTPMRAPLACVAIDLFGEGSITPEMANWIRADLHQDRTIRQYTGRPAFVTGELFQLPAGPVAAALRRRFPRRQPAAARRPSGADRRDHRQCDPRFRRIDQRL